MDLLDGKALWAKKLLDACFQPREPKERSR
jgi:hypothetical protein